MLGAMKTTLDPGGSLDSSKARFNLESYLEETDTSQSCEAISETLKSTMEFCGCNNRTLSGVVPDLEPVRDDEDEDKVNTKGSNEYNGNASDDCDSCVDMSVSTAKLYDDKEPKENTKKKTPSPALGPPKPPRIRPYALVRTSYLDSDSEGSSIASEDFTWKPKKFTIWSTTDDEDYTSDSEKKGHGYWETISKSGN